MLLGCLAPGVQPAYAAGPMCSITPTVSHEVTGGPAFDTDGYHITSSSAAVKAGVTLPTITDDIDGDHRPRDVLYDLGADELNFYVWLPLIKR